MKMPIPDDVEGHCLAADLPPVIDAHVHVFPAALFEAVRSWFDAYAWPVRYRLDARAVVDFLDRRGLAHLVVMQYAHRPGIAASLNRFMADLCRHDPRLTGLATVYPGEAGAASILEQAFALGLGGVKLHAHVQCFALDGAALDEVCRVCSAHQKPLLIHAGREPWSPHYACDPRQLCRADHIESLLGKYPDLNICVPHLGADEFGAYGRLIRDYDNLWLDTTMALADFLPFADVPRLTDLRADRILFGTDFPNIPYAWDREIRLLAARRLPADLLEAVLWRNAAQLYDISLNR
jgi:predicted TIM-barrel fold metal-dependent hydrolase